jgi:hypothetical protein
MSKQAIAQAYFDAVASKDPENIKPLFHETSELHTVAGLFTGPEEIADFYKNTAFNFNHVKPNVGPMVESSDIVACEITLELDDSKNRVADFFTISNDKIDKLVVYLGPDPA